jgi:hypothetical protein
VSALLLKERHDKQQPENHQHAVIGAKPATATWCTEHVPERVQ